MIIPRGEELDVFGPREQETLKRVVRDRTKAFRRNVEWHLWPLVMSGVPADQLALVYLGPVFMGVSLNGEFVIEAAQP